MDKNKQKNNFSHIDPNKLDSDTDNDSVYSSDFTDFEEKGDKITEKTKPNKENHKKSEKKLDKPDDSNDDEIILHTINNNDLDKESNQKSYDYPKITTDYIYIQHNTFPHHEDENIEFKDKNLNDLELSKIFSGFSNNLGGSLFIGISDDRKIQGRKMTDKQLDEFKLFVDNVQQNCTNPPIRGIKINILPVFTPDLIPITGTYIIRIDIPKLNKNICAMDGEKYMRFNASFRTEGQRTFVRIGEFQSIQDKYNNEIAKNKTLKENLDDATKLNSKLKKKVKSYKKAEKKINKEKTKPDESEEKIKNLQEELQKMKDKNKSLEIKLQNYDTIFAEYLLVKKP
jgi:hypothetical protein